MIGIIGAMVEEVDILKSEIKNLDTRKKAGMEFVKGKLLGRDIVLVVSGIGKVNAAICTQILIDIFNVDIIINVGIAGGVKDGINTSDIVIANKLIEHDMDVTSFGYKKGEVPGIGTIAFPCDKELTKIAIEITKTFKDSNVFVGPIVSGDQFISKYEKVLDLNIEFGAYACEMEGASIAHVCYVNKVRCIVIRCISDNAEEEAPALYEEFKEKAIVTSINFIRAFLSNKYFDEV